MALTKVSTGMLSADVASIDLNIDANTMYIDVSNNRVGINNAVPSTALDVTGSVTADGLTSSGPINLTAGALAAAGNAGLSHRSTDNKVYLQAGTGGFNILDDQQNTHFFIDSTGVSSFNNSVGIGTSSPADYADGGDNFVIYKAGDAGMSIVSSATGQGGIYFADGTAAADTTRGRIRYNHADNSMGFRVNNSEAAVIDSSGNLLVGKTSTAFGTAGLRFAPTGAIDATVSGDGSLFLNRLSSDGGMAYFYKDGSPVGSILSSGSDGIIVQGVAAGSGLLFHNSDALLPAQNGNAVDATIDLGRSTPSAFRFKNLYLTGFVRAGAGTAADPVLTGFDGNTGFFFPSGGVTAFTQNGVEGGRFDASGNLLVGVSTFANNTLGVAIRGASTGATDESIRCAVPSTSSTLQIGFYNANGRVGSVATAGSATVFNTSSDQRLKENIVDAPSASDDIDAIQVRSFDWKADGSHQKYGMVAQELQTVAPEAVSAPEDPDDMMGVDYSKLVPMMLKEIQSLRARIAALES